MPTSASSLLALEIMGVRLDLDLAGAGSPELEEAVVRAWDRCVVTPSGPSDAARSVRVVLDADPGVVEQETAAGAVAGSTLLAVMDELTSRIVQEGLEAVIGDRLLLHAGALSDPVTGATVVLVAPSGTGKTTASQALARHLGYVTDETSVIERDGSLTPFPKPLSLLVDGTRPKRQVSPTALEMLPAPAQPWLARIAYLTRDAEAQRVRQEHVPTVEALTLLAEQTSSMHLLESPLGSLAGLLEAQGGLVRLVYAEAIDLLPVIQEWLADAERLTLPTPTADMGLRGVDAADRSAGESTLGPRVRRLPVVDELVRADAMAVMLPGQVFALSPLAAYLLLLVGEAGPDGAPVADLEKVLASEVPLPEEGTVAEALAPMLDDLVARGLLERL